MKKNLTLAVCMLLCALFLPIFSQKAHAFDPNRVYSIVNRSSGLAMEIGGSYQESIQNGRRANQWTYWGAAKQQWYLRQVGQDTYVIINRGSNKALETDAGRPGVVDYSNEGTPVNQWDYQGTVQQQWIISSVGGNSWAIKTRGSNRYLQPSWRATAAGASAGAFIVQGDEVITQAGTWTIQESFGQNEVFEIVNANSHKLLTANPDNNSVSQYPPWGTTTQQWSFSSYNANNYLSIINRNYQQVLEIGGGGDLTLPGRTANVWDGWGGQNQQWALLDVHTSRVLSLAEVRNGMRFQIYNRLSGKMLEIGGNGSELTQDGRAANQWYDWNGPNQQWYLRYVSYNRNAASPTAEAAQIEAAQTEAAAPAALSTVLTLYPNPAHDVLSVSLPGQAVPASATVTDLRGSTTKARYQGDGKVDVSALAPGLYIVKVSDGQREYRQKFAKE